MATKTISLQAFNTALTSAVADIRPKLLALESAIYNPASAPGDVGSAVAALHSALANHLAVADALGQNGGAVALSGGSDKGDGNIDPGPQP